MVSAHGGQGPAPAVSVDAHLLDEAPPADVVPLALNDREQARWWYQAEAFNLVAAVQAANTAGEDRLAWQLAAVLGGIYIHQNAFDDWITTGRIGVESAARLGDRAGLARTLESLGRANFQSRRLDEAEACHRQVLTLRTELGDRFGEAVSINVLGLLALRRRRLDGAAALFRHGADIFIDLGERRWEALLRGNLAEAMCERGEFAAAGRLLRNALQTLREVGDRFGEGDVLFRLAWAHRGAGRHDAARAAIDDALAIADAEINEVWRAHWLTERARLALATGDPPGALTDSQRAAVIQRRLGDRSREATAIDLAGQAYQQLERPDEAADFHRRAASVHCDLGDRWQLAGALDHLATALDGTSERDGAQECRQEAVSLLADFDDPPAVAMRERLTLLLPDR